MTSLRGLAFRMAGVLAYDVILPLLAGIVVWILREATMPRQLSQAASTRNRYG